MSNRLFTFSDGATGPWQIVSMTAVVGDSLPEASRLTVTSGSTDSTTADAKC